MEPCSNYLPGLTPTGGLAPAQACTIPWDPCERCRGGREAASWPGDEGRVPGGPPSALTLGSGRTLALLALTSSWWGEGARRRGTLGTASPCRLARAHTWQGMGRWRPGKSGGCLSPPRDPPRYSPAEPGAAAPWRCPGTCSACLAPGSTTTTTRLRSTAWPGRGVRCPTRAPRALPCEAEAQTKEVPQCLRRRGPVAPDLAVAAGELLCPARLTRRVRARTTCPRRRYERLPLHERGLQRGRAG